MFWAAKNNHPAMGVDFSDGQMLMNNTTSTIQQRVQGKQDREDKEHIEDNEGNEDKDQKLVLISLLLWLLLFGL